LLIRRFAGFGLDRKNVVIDEYIDVFLVCAGDRCSDDEIVSRLKYVERDAPCLRLRAGNYASAGAEESAEEIVEVSDAAENCRF
jgi:hypothetical protein